MSIFTGMAHRGVGPCILAMRMAFKNIVKLPKTFKFIADGYPAYPLAAQQFALNKDNPLNFDFTQVIGLTNDDAVSKEFRPFKQMIERLNRTIKASYRCTCGYDNFDGSNYAVALWVCCYNFLRPHKFNNYIVLPEMSRVTVGFRTLLFFICYFTLPLLFIFYHRRNQIYRLFFMRGGADKKPLRSYYHFGANFEGYTK